MVGTCEDAALIEDFKSVQEGVFERTDPQKVHNHADCSQNTQNNLESWVGLKEKGEEANKQTSEHENNAEEECSPGGRLDLFIDCAKFILKF